MKRIDLQDALLALGLIGLEAGVAMLSTPAALILGGLICLAIVWMIEAAKSRETKRPRPQANA